MKNSDKGLPRRSVREKNSEENHPRNGPGQPIPSLIADIMASKRPSPIRGWKPKMPFHRERTPHQRIIHAAQNAKKDPGQSLAIEFWPLFHSDISHTYVHAGMVRNCSHWREYFSILNCKKFTVITQYLPVIKPLVLLDRSRLDSSSCKKDSRPLISTLHNANRKARDNAPTSNMIVEDRVLHGPEGESPVAPRAIACG